MEEKRFKAKILEDLENITAVALLVVGHYIVIQYYYLKIWQLSNLIFLAVNYDNHDLFDA